MWRSERNDLLPRPETQPSEWTSEDIYERIAKRSDSHSDSQLQFVCASQPLAALLSKDVMLCCDGDKVGFFHPWRTGRYRQVDSALDQFVKTQVAKHQVVKTRTKQKALVTLYFEHLYSLYPVVDYSILEDFDSIPALLRNSMMLAGCRYSDDITDHREFASALFSHCRLLALAETDKIVLVQSLILMTVHEADGTKGMEVSRELISQICCLCGELCLTNYDHVNILDSYESNLTHNSQIITRSLMSRIFWVSFCCDRFVAVTSGRSMEYAREDITIIEPTIDDFMGMQEHFEVFLTWYKVCQLFERTLSACYRPIANRTNDDGLVSDILNLRLPAIANDDMRSFLQISQQYCLLLVLRCQLLPLSYFEHPAPRTLHLARTACMRVLTLKTGVQHLLVLHTLLHASVILYIELLVDRSEENRFKFEQLIARLSNMQTKWWLAAASAKLCTYLTTKVGDTSASEQSWSRFEHNAPLQDINVLDLLDLSDL